MDTKKKIRAALVAVATYIQAEEEALLLPPQKRPTPRNFDSINLWGFSGRQSIMQMRNMFNLKAFNR